MRNYVEQLELSKGSVRDRIDFLANRGQVHREAAQRDESRDNWRRVALWGAAGSCSAQAAGLAFIAGDEPHRHIEHAAMDYSNAGLPFGLFLQTLIVPEGQAGPQLLKSRAGDWVQQIDAAIKRRPDDHESPKDGGDYEASLGSQNQQVYLCLAMVSATTVAREYREPLQHTIEHLRLHPNLLHGPQGQPLQVQLDIIEPAFEMSRERKLGDVPTRATRALARLARHYEESIEAARRNSYLWQHLWSPVEYLDLELVAAANCLARASGSVDFLRTMAESAAIESIPFQVALDIL